MRVIAGSARSLRLVYPRGSETRPTTDAVRESLFSSLGAAVEGAAFADLYAGAGSVGIEALSRGARFCAFVEQDRRCVKALRENLANTGLHERARIVQGDVRRVWPRVCRQWGPFDIVFADPPYGAGELPELCSRLVEGAGGACPGGLVVVQHDAHQALGTAQPPLWTRTYGQTRVTVYRVADPSEAS